LIFDKVTDENKLASFYGSQCSHVGLHIVE